jgi:hypothetical protein
MLIFRRSFPLLMASLLGLVAAERSARATVLSQVTTGISHSGGENGVVDQIGFSTSGGPSGPAQANLSLQIDAPSGQAFQFDSTAYPGVNFGFSFRPIVSGDLTGMAATDPSFELLNPTGSVAVSFLESSAAKIGEVQFVFISNYGITGTGTFSGFRMNTTLTGFSGQTLQWGGGDGDVQSVGYSGSDNGPMLTLVTVPEPVPMLPLAAVALAALAGRRLWRPRS